MTQFAKGWSDLKKSTIKNGHLPPVLVLALSVGRDLGPALVRFDKATKVDERSKALLGVLKEHAHYKIDIKDAKKQAESAKEKDAVRKFEAALEALWKEVEVAGQPPRPSGSMTSHTLIPEFDLSSGHKARYLNVGPTKISVFIEIDSMLAKLMKEGTEELKLEDLTEVAYKELESARKAMTGTIQSIENNIKAGKYTAAEKVNEANEVLKYYARLVEDSVNRSVERVWAGYVARKAYLKEFKTKSRVKIVLGVVGVGVAATSIALSMGAAWMSYYGIVKAVLELAQTVHKMYQGIDKTKKNLERNIATVEKLNTEREQARAKNRGQTVSKSKEVAKELLNEVLPISKSMLKGASAIESDAKQLLGQVHSLDKTAGKLFAEYKKASKELGDLSDKNLTDAQKTVKHGLIPYQERLFTEIHALQAEARAYQTYGDDALKAVKKLKEHDAWSATLASQSASNSTKAGGLVAVARFGVDLTGVSEFLCARTTETCPRRRASPRDERPARWSSRRSSYALAFVNRSS